MSTGLLLRTGPGSPSIVGLQDHYVYMPMIEGSRRDLFQLVPVLGAEYLYRLCAPSLVHIAGTNAGVPVAGTGLVVQASHILTCRHVVSDMALDQSQVFQGREYVINADSIHRHPDLDVAVMRVDGVFAWPTTWFVDREGRIQFVQVGASNRLDEEFMWRVEASREGAEPATP